MDLAKDLNTPGPQENFQQESSVTELALLKDYFGSSYGGQPGGVEPVRGW